MVAPTLRQFRTLLRIIETGSISAAAQELDVTQPAASQQLRALERTLGVRLLERASGRMIPTAAGVAVLGPARRAAEAAAEAQSVVKLHQAGDTGRVRLGTGATVCIHLLPPVLAAVKRRMPGLELVVATGNTPDLLGRLEKGDLDVAVVTLSGGIGRALSVRPLFYDPMVALVPERVMPDRGAFGPVELSSLPLILYERGSSTRTIIEGWFRRAGRMPRPAMELGSVEAIKVLVAGGLGASILPELALGHVVAGVRQVALRPRLARRIGLVMRHEKVMEKGLRFLIEELDQSGVARTEAP